MQTSVMITNGGPHSAKHWAVVTAGQIVQIGGAAHNSIHARALEHAIITILTEYHGAVQNNERSYIVEHGTARLSHGFDLHVDSIASAVAAIVEAAHGTEFEAHFSNPATQIYLNNLISKHSVTNMQVERDWHFARNQHADCPHVKAYRNRREHGDGHPMSHYTAHLNQK